jgi:hypothetical protein
MLFLFVLGALASRLPLWKDRLKCYLYSFLPVLSDNLIVLALGLHFFAISAHGVWSKAFAAVSLDSHALSTTTLSILFADLFVLSYEIYETYVHKRRKH